MNGGGPDKTNTFILEYFVGKNLQFVIPGTRTENCWQGYETFFPSFVGVQKF